MANKFQDKAVDLDASISKHPISDDFKTLKNEKAILQHIDLLLMQSETAVLFRPYVCAGLRQMLFETWSPLVRVTIEKRIEKTLIHEPRIKVTSIEVSQDEHDINITIRFIFIDTDQELVYKSTLKRVL